VKWTEDLSVGVDEIDHQHKELISRINNLVDAIKQAKCKYTIDGTIDFLEEYATRHFGAEEVIMLQNMYEGYSTHKAQHAIFLKALAELKQQAAEPRVKGSSYDLSVTTNQVVVDWIVNHILKTDMKLGEFLRKKIGDA
jgi:hemerythrin